MQSISQDLALLQQTRKNFLELITPYSLDQLNHIPEGYKNNLIWNFCHVVVTQQLLCYAKAGLPVLMSNDLVDQFKKGSAPTTYIDADTFTQLKSFSSQALEQLPQDYEKGIFDNYAPYQTSYGVLLSSVEEAIKFNNAHEGVHYGYALALRKLIQ